MSNNFYITTTLPYVNAEPHIGFGMEIVAADVIARYHRLLGKDVIFNTGTDEHGQKIYQNASEAGQDTQEYVDHYAAKFENLKNLFGLEYTHFIRTTNPDHKKAAQEFWSRCFDNGDIYKKMYKVKYCVGCELEKQDSELVDGRCPLHPNRELEIREEENYFFAFSKYQDKLLELYQKYPQFVKPAGKLNEIRSFVEGGLQDFSISRLKSKMPWGVEVPNDPDHVMYVWFDALVNYVSTLGWPDENGESEFVRFWGEQDNPHAIQIAGKDNLRQQSAMWQAMLISAGLPTSRQILINGFISIDGQKMSKSLGNVISPAEMVDRYGSDASRFLLMFSGPVGSDIDTSWEKFDTIYTAHLCNGLGNLCSRVAKMCEKSDFNSQISTPHNFETEFSSNMSHFEIKTALEQLLSLVSNEDKYLAEQKPWTKSGSEQTEILQHSVEEILKIAWHIQPFMPQTAKQIIEHFTQDKIVALKPLFPRLAK